VGALIAEMAKLTQELGGPGESQSDFQSGVAGLEIHGLDKARWERD